MFNITELDELVCERLDRKSLAQCAIVNKTWHEGVMPLLFKNIPELKTQRQRQSFRSLVLEDYHLKEECRLEKQRRKQREKRQKQRQKKRELQAQEPPQPTVIAKSGDTTPSKVPPAEKRADNSDTGQHEGRPLSLLSRYGGCIRTIPEVEDLLSYLEVTRVSTDSLEAPLQMSREDPEALELLVSFLSRCTNLRQPRVELNEDHFEDLVMLQVLATYIVPATVHLVITVQDDLLCEYDSDDTDDEIANTMRLFGVDDEEYGDGDEEYSDDEGDRDDDSKDCHLLSTWNLKIVLASSSSKLESLTLDITSWDTTEPESEVDVAGRKDYLTGLKKLRIDRPGKDPASIRCWDWLWKHANSIQNLRVERTFPEFTVSLIRGIAVHLSRLEKIHLGRKVVNTWNDKVDFEDSIIAKVLSAGRNYTAIYLDITARPGPATIQAIPRHYSSLTEFTMEISTGDDSFLVDIMAFSPRLRKLVTINNGEYPFVDNGYDFYPKVLAETFTDLDPSTKSYRLWACEESLETLHIKIDGIPFQGEKRLLIHRKVYERLARLTNLKFFWLGHYTSVPDVEGGDGGQIEEDVQEESLEMTLEAGLATLSPLKGLRQLNLHGLCHDISAMDIQWMVDSWPKLDTIWGLCDGPGHEWLQKHRPSLLGEAPDLWEGSEANSDVVD